MIKENLALLFEKDMRKLQKEINSYSSEANLWLAGNGITNAGGNLCLHLLGNLQHYIGLQIGGFAYTRNRPLEFSDKNVPITVINELIEHTIQVVTAALKNMPESSLDTDYPENVLGESMTHEYFLLHLLAHLNYHLGQINYHRRLFDK
ncbi:MAG: hypothetical protein RLZZ28_1912 [Bacteroidota bacterium]